MELPTFRPTSRHREWVQSERRTAAFIRAFWKAASARQRKDREFLWFLTASAWTNIRPDGTGDESTREWRNNILASYLGVKYRTLTGLAAALHVAMPRFSAARARRLVATHTGITHHYTAIRPRTRRYVLRHAAEVHDLFASVSSRLVPPEATIRTVAERLARMPEISTPRGGKTSPFNALSPVLACLDPRRRFPIMNQRTHRLLRAIGREHDGDGAVALHRLIGSRGIRDSFELDVYSQIAESKLPSAPRRVLAVSTAAGGSRRNGRRGVKLVPVKTELDSFAQLVARRVQIRKEHNKLTNRFRQAVFADIRPQEAGFDLLIDRWKKRRSLLIEAKTAWRGASGRAQIRQAIGQLFDYRLQYFPRNSASVDLAVLVPTEPSEEIKTLLGSVGIAAIWFSGRRLAATVRLPW
jgi:hypothetical protein